MVLTMAPATFTSIIQMIYYSNTTSYFPILLKIVLEKLNNVLKITELVSGPNRIGHITSDSKVCALYQGELPI